MTDDGRPPAQDRPSSGAPEVPDARAEQVLSQALRLMAGGTAGQQRRADASLSPVGRRLTTGQLLLLAAIVGLLIGIAAGFLSLV